MREEFKLAMKVLFEGLACAALCECVSGCGVCSVGFFSDSFILFTKVIGQHQGVCKAKLEGLVLFPLLQVNVQWDCR